MSARDPDCADNVLFPYTGNPARSILAELLFHKYGKGRFHGYSAGNFPKPDVNPMTLEVLSSLGFSPSGPRSKRWDEFALPGASETDCIITACDDATGKVCPVWLGNPASTPWGIENPAAVEGKCNAFVQARDVNNRITILLALPFESIDTVASRHKPREIGGSEGATSAAWVRAA